jgi:tetratricopeptide (TPR) repeat protein
MTALLLDASLRSAFMAGAIGLLLAALRIRAAAVRHAAWTAVAAAMLVLPILGPWVPRIPVPLPGPAAAAVTMPEHLWIAATSQLPVDESVPAVSPTTPADRATAPAVPAGRPRHAVAMPPGSTLTAVWLAGVCFFGLRLTFGLRGVARLRRSSAPLAIPGVSVPRRAALAASPAVSAPLTFGFLRPLIVLPESWPTWRPDTLRTVLAHEFAHVDRRDAWTMLIAQVNLCVFWFHPLAWWLDRHLAELAEASCDDRSIDVAGGPQAYAALLVRMANGMRRDGARVAWRAIGMAGAGRLDRRISRLFHGAQPPTGRIARTVLAAASALIVGMGLACRQAPAALGDNPEAVAAMQMNAARSRQVAAARDLTADQVAALEQKVAANPDDLDDTETLVLFYRQSGQKRLGWNGMIEARRPYALRIVERFPESELAATPLLIQASDPAGYAEARQLWLRHVDAPGASPAILANAAAFFAVSEKPLAEQLLARALAADPDGPQPRITHGLDHLGYATRLGELYASDVLGIHDNPPGAEAHVDVAEARGPVGLRARHLLDASTNPALLVGAAQYVMARAQSAGAAALDLDPMTLARGWLERARTLDPQSDVAQRLLAAFDESARRQRLRTRLPEGVDSSDADLATLSDRERFDFFPDLAMDAYMVAESVEAPDPARAAMLVARAEQLARGTLHVADQFRDDPHYSPAVFSAHITLGTVALRHGDRRGAVAELGLATNVPPSPGLSRYQDPWYTRLTNHLLKAGERDSVLAFYEQAARLLPLQRRALLDAAAAVRQGLAPVAYQYAFMRRSH